MNGDEMIAVNSFLKTIQLLAKKDAANGEVLYAADRIVQNVNQQKENIRAVMSCKARLRAVGEF